MEFIFPSTYCAFGHISKSELIIIPDLVICSERKFQWWCGACLHFRSYMYVTNEIWYELGVLVLLSECWLESHATKCESKTSSKTTKTLLLVGCADFCFGYGAFVYARPGSSQCGSAGCICTCVVLSTCKKQPDINFHLYKIGPPTSGIFFWYLVERT